MMTDGAQEKIIWAIKTVYKQYVGPNNNEKEIWINFN